MVAFCTYSLSCHMPYTPIPQVLQQWLFSPTSRPNASSALSHGKCSTYNQQCSPCPYMSMPKGSTFPASVSLFITMTASLGDSEDMGDTGVLTALPPPRLLMSPARLVLSFAPTLSSLSSHTVSHHTQPWHVIIIATVATTTKAPRSNGCNPWDSDIALSYTLSLLCSTLAI